MVIRFIDAFNALQEASKILLRGSYQVCLSLEEGYDYLSMTTSENGTLFLEIGDYDEADEEGFVEFNPKEKVVIPHKGYWTDPDAIAKLAMRMLVHNHRHLIWWEAENWT